MKHLIWSAAVGCLGLTATAAHADQVSFQLETSVASGYVSRGIVQYAHDDDRSSQTAATLRVDQVGPGALTFGVWNAVALSGYRGQPGNALELDLSAGYALDAGPLAITTGYAAYLFPGHDAGAPLDGAHEVFATAAYGNRYVVPSCGVWVEPVHQQGAYLTLGATRDFHHRAWTVTPALSIGAAAYRKYLGADQVAGPHLNDVTAGLATRLDLGAGLYAAARVSYAIRTTPDDLMGPAMDTSMSLGGRSTLVGLVALGVAR
jgi:hypothetical protein